MQKDIIDRLNNNELSTGEIKALIKNYSSVSMGIKDLMFIHRLEDELINRQYIKSIYKETTKCN